MEATKSEKLVEVSLEFKNKIASIVFVSLKIAWCLDIHDFFFRLIDIALVL